MDLKDVIEIDMTPKPPRILIHSKHGLGKSSWAAVAPKPIFIITEDGLTKIKVDHFPLVTTKDEIFKYMALLLQEDHQYKTVVIDTLDWLEKIFWKEVCTDKGVSSIEEIGYAKGYTFAMVYHDKMIAGLTRLRDRKNIAIVLICHNEVKTFNNPEGENYDQYVLKLHKKAAAKYEEFCDAVLFLNHKAYVIEGEGLNKNKATGSGERSIFTEPRPSFTAKSRYNLPFEIPYLKGEGFTNFLKLIKEGDK